MNLDGKSVVVTGGSGFLGRVLVEKLRDKNARVHVPRSKNWNFIRFDKTYEYFQTVEPDIVIHSAAFYGGLGLNYKRPGEIYFKNTIMCTNVIEACRLAKVKKFIGIGTGCAYPNGIDRPMTETDFWSGKLHDSVIHYGGVRKMMQVQCEAYKKQYDFNGIHVVLMNLYGEWDSYSWERSHVVAALIRKFVEAKRNDSDQVEVWGTGKPIREFVYVRDAAEGIIRATESYDDTEPLNIGTGIGTSIKKLVELIQKITGFNGHIVWNTTYPDGQYFKTFDVSKLKRVLNWELPTSLEEGLKRTISWFEENYETAIERW